MPDGPEDLHEVAADWADRLPELDEAGRRELAQWLARSDAHARAFATMRRLLSDPALLDGLEAPEGIAAAFPAQRPTRTPVRLFGRGSAPAPLRPRASRRQALAAGLAGALAAPLAIYGLTRSLAPQPSGAKTLRLASAIGERRELALPDGSNLILDAASRVALDFTTARRTVHLEKGAAHFEVHHDAQRPFEVLTSQARMVALGTRFSVERLSQATELRVYEGRVGLDTDFGAPRTLPAREWVLIGDTALLGQGRFDPASGNDWQNDWLDAEAMPLGEAIERLARYTPRPIRLEDPAMARLTFSGRFRLDQPEESLGLIGSLFALHLAARGGALVLVHDSGHDTGHDGAPASGFNRT